MSVQVIQGALERVVIRDLRSPGEAHMFRAVIVLAVANHGTVEIELTPRDGLALQSALDVCLQAIEAQRLVAFGELHGISPNGQIHQQAINLEGLNDHELTMAAKHPGLHLDIRTMANLILKARVKRKDGKIQDALSLERKVDALYSQLPENLRW